MASIRFLVGCVPKAEFTKVQLGPVDHHGQWEWWEIPDEDGKNMKNLTKSFTMHQSPIRQIALCQHFWLLFSKIHLINFKPWNPKTCSCSISNFRVYASCMWISCICMCRNSSLIRRWLRVMNLLALSPGVEGIVPGSAWALTMRDWSIHSSSRRSVPT